MRIISWNCGGAFRKKFSYLRPYDADILIIQECEQPVRLPEVIDSYPQTIWTGHLKYKGLIILAKSGLKLERLDLENITIPQDWLPRNIQGSIYSSDALRYFISCRVNNTFNLIGIWACRSTLKYNRMSYIGQIWLFWQAYHHHFSSDPTIIIGDFNSNSIWDKKHRYWSHSKQFEAFLRYDIHSLYHHQTSEQQGLEKHPTFYMHRKQDKPYHIDYACLSSSLLPHSRLEIGDSNQWLQLSDHMPLVLDVDLTSYSK